MSKEQKKFIVRGFTRGLAVGAVAGGVGALFGAWVKDKFPDLFRFGAKANNIPPVPKDLPVAPESKGSIPIPPESKPPTTPFDSPHAQPRGQTNANPHSFTPTHDVFPYPDIPVNPPDVSPNTPLNTNFPPGYGGREGDFTPSANTPVETVTPSTSPSLESNPEYTKLSEIKKGEGIWHAVRRQLNYQMSHTSPEEFANRYGLTPEDIQQHPKKSVERITANLLVDQDYIKPNSGGSEQLANGKNTYQWRKPGGNAWTETRIAKPGVHVILDENGKIEIADAGKTIPANTPGARPDVANEALFADAQEALKKPENASDLLRKVSPLTPTEAGTPTPIGADKFGTGAESGLLQDGSPGATTEEYKALRGMGPQPDEFPRGKAPDRAPTAEILTDAQREAMQLKYRGLPEKGAGEIMGGGKEASPSNTNFPPAYGGREEDFTNPSGPAIEADKPTPIGADRFGKGPESGILADGSDGATIEEYKTVRGVGPADNEFRKGFAPDRAPATGVLTDAQREAMQLDYQGLPEKGAGEIIGGAKKASPIDPMGLGNEMMQRSAVFPHPEDAVPTAPASSAAEIIKEAIPQQKSISHAIGKRGPEGAIIDEFRNNPELAKQFGWDGKKNINTWAGKEADVLYKAYRKESLGNPTIVEEMEKLGYKPTAGGHESMMHRIKSGSVELDPATKSFTLKDTYIIKATDTEQLFSETEKTARKMSGLSIDNYTKVRDTSLAEFLKKHPRGKGFQVLAEMLQQVNPTKADMQQSIGQFLTSRFGK